MEKPPADTAAKILDRESRSLADAATEAAQRVHSPAAALGAAGELMTRRGRYLGSTGEHFGVQEVEGIAIIDALDERLLRAVHQVLKTFVDARRKHPPDLKILASLAEKLGSGLREMPQYPVAYMVLYAIRMHYDRFEQLANGGDHDLAELEHAMVHFLLGVVDKYVQTRERPVVRHFSDVAREYSVVTRLKCACGEEKYDVKTQSLAQDPQGRPHDRLDLECRSCGAKRTITFDLPHFQDMYKI